MKRLLSVFFVIATAFLLYAGYAAYSIGEIVKGIETGDSDLLAAHIDFPAVRASLKTQLREAMAAEPAAAKSIDADAGKGLAAVLRSAMAGNLIDAVVTPAGVAALMAKRRAEGALRNPTFSLSALLDHLSAGGPAELRLGEGGGEELVLGFRDWTWKIVDVRASPEKLRRAGVLSPDRP